MDKSARKMENKRTQKYMLREQQEQINALIWEAQIISRKHESLPTIMGGHLIQDNFAKLDTQKIIDNIGYLEYH